LRIKEQETHLTLQEHDDDDDDDDDDIYFLFLKIHFYFTRYIHNYTVKIDHIIKRIEICVA